MSVNSAEAANKHPVNFLDVVVFQQKKRTIFDKKCNVFCQFDV